MKVTRKHLRELIWSQLSVESDEVRINEAVQCTDEEILSEGVSSTEDFDVVNDQTLLKEAEQKIEEMKSINREMKRMKQLVDFRSPLLSSEDL